MNFPQVKICGLTRIDEALACAELGADAIGLVFYPKSPRNVSEKVAREIVTALPPGVVPTGVFVNETYEGIMGKVERCGLKAIQLHGNESPDLVHRLMDENLTVIKVLYMESEPHVRNTCDYHPSAYLVECAKGVLPGGNAMSWNFQNVRQVKTDKPLIIAGGLDPDNISSAVLSAEPDAVDVSSGVEREPGFKDLAKVALFIAHVKACDMGKKPRRIF
ncbi:MAG: phosphoribosylanthranilate isomerase [Desulfobacteraceae bacterium]|jgi:phosphoribosylanthranilate isomerase